MNGCNCDTIWEKGRTRYSIGILFFYHVCNDMHILALNIVAGTIQPLRQHTEPRMYNADPFLPGNVPHLFLCRDPYLICILTRTLLSCEFSNQIGNKFRPP